MIATPKGGTHVTGFERALVRTLNEQLCETRLLQERRRPGQQGGHPRRPDRRRHRPGARAAVRGPDQGGARHLRGRPHRLPRGQPRAQGAVRQPAARRSSSSCAPLLEKIVAAAKARIAAREHRENQRRKSALENSALPAKLVDCRSDDIDRSELFIVEGDSALGTAKLARDSEFQALLPIRGKILNVQKASVADMLKNAECAAIIQVVGAGSGRSFDLESARYGKVILMADADVDGAHIRCLLLTLFHRYMRPMVEAGRVFAAVPPLHRIEVINPGRGKDKYIYMLLRRRAAAGPARPGAARQALEGPDAALQGPR